jgi:DNA-binding SARP family transcriptional activator
MTVFCRTLGPVELKDNGGDAPAELLQRKNLALLIYLARSPKRTRSREHLIGILWGEKPESKARHSLREAVRILRRTLGEDGLVTEADQVRLSADAVQLDTETFEQLEASEDWSAAAEMVGGEFLEGLSVREAWAFEEWLGAERVRWRSRSVAALIQRAEELLAAGKSAEATAISMRANMLDSGASAVRMAMKALAISGDRTEALGRYEAFRLRLEELGAEPDGETLELLKRIQQERAWTLPKSVPTDKAKGAELRRAPLIGREGELAQLVGVWTAAVEGSHAAVTVIEGDPGTGKTRLAEELVTRARLDGATVATIRAVEADIDGSGLLGIARGGLFDGPGLATASPSALGTFANQIPEWADRFGPPKGDIAELSAATIDIVRVLAGERAVFILVDDAQWCDRETLLALSAMLRDLSALPVHVCIAMATQPSRPELDDIRSRIGRDLKGVAVRTDKLSETALREIVTWAVPTYSDEQIDRLARRVASDSAGLPLLAVELLHAVALGLDLEETTGAWPQPLKTLSQTLPGDLPDAIVAAIRIGYRRLSKSAQQVLAAAAVLGERITEKQLEACTDVRGAELHTALDELEWQRWITADARGYSFVARIVCEVVQEDMVTDGQKRRIKEAVTEK